ncbi:MAG: hypothetical protein ACRYG5_03090 [Janthinobacterium lividum]
MSISQFFREDFGEIGAWSEKRSFTQVAVVGGHNNVPSFRTLASHTLAMSRFTS